MLFSGSLPSQGYIPVQFMIGFVCPFIPPADCWQETATYMTVPHPEIDLFSRHKNLIPDRANACAVYGTQLNR